MWVQDMSAGRGWIAIALVIFANMEPSEKRRQVHIYSEE
jgi:ABC-type uncharacterized transport system permease subunit